MNCNVSYEELAAYAAGDLGADRRAQIRGHLADCPDCRRRLAALGQVDAALASARPARPPARAVLDARRALAEILGAPRGPEILTLDEVAKFLRLGPDELGEVVEELPAFELAGKIRVRRARLIEWIQQREREYARHAAASWAARLSAGRSRKGVA